MFDSHLLPVHPGSQRQEYEYIPSSQLKEPRQTGVRINSLRLQRFVKMTWKAVVYNMQACRTKFLEEPLGDSPLNERVTPFPLPPIELMTVI